jgi:hypothetical protein
MIPLSAPSVAPRSALARVQQLAAQSAVGKVPASAPWSGVRLAQSRVSSQPRPLRRRGLIRRHRRVTTRRRRPVHSRPSGVRQGGQDIRGRRDGAGLVDSGCYNIGWHGHRTAVVMPDAVLDQDATSPPRVPSRRRRLSDYILIAFHSACDQGDFEAADHLLGILEQLLLRPSPVGQPERRTDIQPLVAALERLWTLRHPEARDE